MAAVKRDPLRHVGVDLHQTGAYEYIDYPQREPQRVITVQGARLERAGTDADGISLYRGTSF